MANSQSKFYGFLGLILVAGAALIGYVALSNRGATAEAGAPDALTLQRLLDSETAAEDLGVARGPSDAPIVVEEYADYLCAACGMVATLTIPQILENYADAGKIRFVFYDFPLNPGSPAELGAQAARCAGDQGAFWAMQRVLMSRQREWGMARDVVGVIRQYADALSLDGRAVEDCVDRGVYRAVVMASGQRARQLGLNQTPTFIINGRVVLGMMGYDRFAQLIEAELASSPGAGEASDPARDQ
jgi:protein-disulfide isomerase